MHMYMYDVVCVCVCVCVCVHVCVCVLFCRLGECTFQELRDDVKGLSRQIPSETSLTVGGTVQRSVKIMQIAIS